MRSGRDGENKIRFIGGKLLFWVNKKGRTLSTVRQFSGYHT
jgi:hypothetical protein